MRRMDTRGPDSDILSIGSMPISTRWDSANSSSGKGLLFMFIKSKNCLNIVLLRDRIKTKFFFSSSKFIPLDPRFRLRGVVLKECEFPSFSQFFFEAGFFELVSRKISIPEIPSVGMFFASGRRTSL